MADNSCSCWAEVSPNVVRGTERIGMSMGQQAGQGRQRCDVAVARIDRRTRVAQDGFGSRFGGPVERLLAVVDYQGIGRVDRAMGEDALVVQRAGFGGIDLVWAVEVAVEAAANAHSAEVAVE